MSTPALIIVHVRPNDVGKMRKCDTNKIHLRTYEDVEKRVKIFQPNLKGEELEKRVNWEVACYMVITPDALAKRLHRVKLPEYLCIYHHWDGHINSLGKELKEKYSTYEDAINLALAGSFSTILEGSVPYMRLEQALWENNKPYKWDSIRNDVRMAYDYLFDNGKWYVRTCGETEFREF